MSDSSYPPDRSDYSYRHFKLDAESLYNHLLDLRKIERPEQMIDRFRLLFVDGTSYSEPSILETLHRLVRSKWAETEFALILNRCCYILINYWWLHAELKQSTVALVDLLSAPPSTSGIATAPRRLRSLVRQFVQSEQYAEMQDRARIIDAVPSADDAKNQPLRTLIPRYPYLYPYCLLTWDSSESGQQAVRQLQAKRERQFEQDLLRYTTNRLRQPANQNRQVSQAEPLNPTLLSTQQVDIAIKRFAGKAEGAYTYRDRSRQFVEYSKQASSYRAVKRQMYDYLASSIQYSDRPEYGKHHFNRWLADQLEGTFSQNDNLKPTGSLLVQTCGQLIDSLVASPARPQHHCIFVDLTSNLGATFTIGLVLKLMLLCRDIQPNLDAIRNYLARRFATILKHYESMIRRDIEWLVECLENLMLAFSIHFGQADFSWIHLL